MSTKKHRKEEGETPNEDQQQQPPLIESEGEESGTPAPTEAVEPTVTTHEELAKSDQPKAPKHPLPAVNPHP